MLLLTDTLRSPMVSIVASHIKSGALPLSASALGLPPEDEPILVGALVDATLRAFTSHDMLSAVRLLLAGAVGSFGLVLTHSLESDSQLVIAARGQSMSFAVYPALGAVVFGSETQATHVGLDLEARTLLPKATSDGGADHPVRARATPHSTAVPYS
jgi:hypothetical protein